MRGTPAQIATWAIRMVEKAPEKIFEVKEIRKKRTMSQNSYYWALLYEVGKALRMSQTELHNRMLRDYSYPELIGGHPIRALIPDTDQAERDTLQMDKAHLKPTMQTTTLADGITYRTYVMLKGSHAMTVDEFSYLLEGLVHEAKQQGVETMTPKELEELRRYALQEQKKQGDRNK